MCTWNFNFHTDSRSRGSAILWLICMSTEISRSNKLILHASCFIVWIRINDSSCCPGFDSIKNLVLLLHSLRMNNLVNAYISWQGFSRSPMGKFCNKTCVNVIEWLLAPSSYISFKYWGIMGCCIITACSSSKDGYLRFTCCNNCMHN